jgi:hypothetical protein
MIAKNLANIHQCDRYEGRYWLVESRVSTTVSAATDLACDFVVETNGLLGDGIESSFDTLVTPANEIILSHIRI